MSREVHVRFWESAGARFPRATHLPLYRLEGIFRRQGVTIPRSTQSGWIQAIETQARPLLEWMREDLCRSERIQTDDTRVPVQAPGAGKTKTGYLWVYLGDETHPWVLFDYTPTRSRAGPDAFLDSFRNGYLQADGYSGYNGLYARTGILQVGCWMHARRYFWDAWQGKDSRALEALAMVRQLYEIEKVGADMSADRRRAHRQEKAVPVLKAFEAWMDPVQPGVLPKSLLGQALTYARNQWVALGRYVEDGGLSIDNGASERAIRPVALGRKNWLFAGSDAGAVRAAGIYSLLGTCRRHNLDPFRYLRDLFERLPGWPESRLGELTPVAWAQETKTRPKAVVNT